MAKGVKRVVDPAKVEEAIKKLIVIDAQEKLMAQQRKELINDDVRQAIIAELKNKIAMFDIKSYQLFTPTPNTRTKKVVAEEKKAA